MPPPSYGSRISTRSTDDHEAEIDCDHISKSDSSDSSESSDEETNLARLKNNGVGIVKSFLGPSFEDAVLKTLELGKALIQKSEEGEDACEEKNPGKDGRRSPVEKPKHEVDVEMRLKEGCADGEVKPEWKNLLEGRTPRKRIVFTAKLDEDPRRPPLANKQMPSHRRLTNVSKIRSLDSDLKQAASSPEKIKRQLEALIQINKEEPPEHPLNWSLVPKNPNFVEMTVMPSFCLVKADNDCNGSSSGDFPSRKAQVSNAQCSTSRIACSPESRTPRKRLGASSGFCQGPELISSALGPTIDVSIIDNLKMMRDLFTCDSGRGEGAESGPEDEDVCEPSLNREEDMPCKIEEMVKRIRELEQKERCLLKEIEEYEQERECRRKACEEEEQKMCNMKNCLEGLIEEEKKRTCCRRKSLGDTDLEAKHETLKQRIRCEEEKLARLKDQHECYKRELMDAKNKTEALKRNKCLLDAWDVFASRVCHTRLPSFSKAYLLERKQFKSGDAPEDLPCCFLSEPPPAEPPRHSCGRKSRSASKCGSINSDTSACKSKGSQTSVKSCKPAPSDVPFPIQRDITCGLHQSLKSCCCGQPPKKEATTCRSEDDLLKKCGTGKTETVKRNNSCSRQHDPCKPACRSVSEAALRKDKCSKVVKVMWAVTRINIFQDNCRTYEVMDATSTPPPCVPLKTEGIFVVKNPQKKICSAQKRCDQRAPF